MAGMNVMPLIETTHPFGASALEFGVLLTVCRSGKIGLSDIADQLHEYYEIWFSERDIRLTVRALADCAYVSEEGDLIAPAAAGTDVLEVYLRAFVRMIDGGRNIFAIGVVAKFAGVDFERRSS